MADKGSPREETDQVPFKWPASRYEDLDPNSSDEDLMNLLSIEGEVLDLTEEPAYRSLEGRDCEECFCKCNKEKPCNMCEIKKFECAGTCRCCEKYRLYGSSIKRENNCDVCVCKVDEEPCHLCVMANMECIGTCPCCEEYRFSKEVDSILLPRREVKTSSSSSDSNSSSEEYCEDCHCIAKGSPCDICRDAKFECNGSCPCCAGYRRLLSDRKDSSEMETSPSETKNSDPKNDA